MQRLIVVLILLLMLAAPSAGAQTRVALVIGNSAYEHAPALTNPTNDAADIAASLERLGFGVRTELDLDFDSLRRTLREFADEAAGADMAAVYFAGHGLEVGGQNYLVPVDARLRTEREVIFEVVPLDHLLRVVEGAKDLGLVLLDACRDNPFVSTMQMASATRSLSRGLSRVDPAGGVLVGYAAKAGTIAADGDARNSPYTAALLEHLETPGLEIRLLFGKVRDHVLARTHNTQEPFVYGSLGGEPVYLVPPGSSIGADYAMAERIGTAEAWQAFLARHGYNKNSFYVQLARAASGKLDGAGRPDSTPQSTILQRQRRKQIYDRILGQESLEPETLVPDIQQDRAGASTTTLSSQYPPDIRSDPLPYVAGRVVEGSFRVAPLAPGKVTTIAKTPPPKPVDETITLAPGSTLGDRLVGLGVTVETARLLLEAIEAEFPTALIKPDQTVTVSLDKQLDFYGNEVIYPVRLSFSPSPGKVIDVEAGLNGHFVARMQGEGETGPALNRSIQQNLKRLGCYDLGIDGIWGTGSRRALRQYYRQTGNATASLEPTSQVLSTLQGATGMACK